MKSILEIVFCGCVMVAAALSGCHKEPYGGALLTRCKDGNYTTEVHVFTNIDQMAREYAATTGVTRRLDDSLPVMEGVDPHGKHHIFMMEPRGTEDRESFQALGHAFSHTVCGEFHPSSQ